jgi:hypothetical protein
MSPRKRPRPRPPPSASRRRHPPCRPPPSRRRRRRSGPTLPSSPPTRQPPTPTRCPLPRRSRRPRTRPRHRKNRCRWRDRDTLRACRGTTLSRGAPRARPIALRRLRLCIGPAYPTHQTVATPKAARLSLLRRSLCVENTFVGWFEFSGWYVSLSPRTTRAYRCVTMRVADTSKKEAASTTRGDFRTRLSTPVLTGVQQRGDTRHTAGRASLQRPRTREPTTMP